MTQTRQGGLSKERRECTKQVSEQSRAETRFADPPGCPSIAGTLHRSENLQPEGGQTSKARPMA